MSPMNFAPDVALPADALAELRLAHGSHEDRTNGLCALEIVAWLANEPHSDHPVCTCPALGAFVRAWNDTLSDEDRDRLLKPLLPRLLDTRSTDAVQDRRAWMAFDWLIRECAPQWLVMVKDLEPFAARLRALPEVVDLSTATGAGAEALEAATAASAAWSAARSAAWSAARSAARSAAESAAESAAWSAAESAAWSAARSAARSAAWSAARSAAESAARSAAESAARSAAWSAAESAAWSAAESALKDTEQSLQQSALVLVERMLAVTPETVAAERWSERVVE